ADPLAVLEVEESGRRPHPGRRADPVLHPGDAPGGLRDAAEVRDRREAEFFFAPGCEPAAGEVVEGEHREPGEKDPTRGALEPSRRPERGSRPFQTPESLRGPRPALKKPGGRADNGPVPHPLAPQPGCLMRLRRNRLSNPSLQLRLVAVFLCTAALAVQAEAILITYTLTKLAERMPTDGSLLLSELPEFVRTNLLLTFAILAPTALGVGIIATFRIAGPLYRIEQFLLNMKEGRQIEACTIRNG